MSVNQTFLFQGRFFQAYKKKKKKKENVVQRTKPGASVLLPLLPAESISGEFRCHLQPKTSQCGHLVSLKFFRKTCWKLLETPCPHTAGVFLSFSFLGEGECTTCPSREKVRSNSLAHFQQRRKKDLNIFHRSLESLSFPYSFSAVPCCSADKTSCFFFLKASPKATRCPVRESEKQTGTSDAPHNSSVMFNTHSIPLTARVMSYFLSFLVPYTLCVQNTSFLLFLIQKRGY